MNISFSPQWIRVFLNGSGTTFLWLGVDSDKKFRWIGLLGTTDPMAPFGVVTLASSGAEGADNAMGAMRVAQTAGYGVPLPIY